MNVIEEKSFHIYKEQETFSKDCDKIDEGCNDM